MSEIVTPEILYSQQAGIIGALEALASRLDGELKTRPVTVRQEADAALVAALDQLNAGVRELRELVAKPLAPPEVNVAAPNLEPVQQAVAHLAELVSALPEQIGKRMNIRIAAGGVASPTSAVQIKDTVSATIDPATQPTLQGVRDRLDSMETILSGKGSEATLTSVKTNLDDLKLLVDTVEAKLQSLIGEIDDGTLDTVTGVLKQVRDQIDGLEPAIGTTADAETALTVIGRLKRTVTLLSSLDAKNFSTEVTLAALKTRADLLATEATLSALKTHIQGSRDAKQAEPAAFASGVFTTLVSHTPTVAIIVTGFNADASTLLDIRFRYRLVVGGVVKIEESITSGQNSWIGTDIDVAAGVVVKVEARHGEIGDTALQGAMSWRER